MDDYLKEALEITRAQAGVRIMTEEEIAAFIQKVAMGIRAVAEGEAPVELDSAEMAQEARKSVKEKSVTCLECGKSFKILTKRHLASHGMDTAEYRGKVGLQERCASCLQSPATRASQKDERYEAVGKARRKVNKTEKSRCMAGFFHIRCCAGCRRVCRSAFLCRV